MFSRQQEQEWSDQGGVLDVCSLMLADGLCRDPTFVHAAGGCRAHAGVAGTTLSVEPNPCRSPGPARAWEWALGTLRFGCSGRRCRRFLSNCVRCATVSTAAKVARGRRAARPRGGTPSGCFSQQARCGASGFQKARACAPLPRGTAVQNRGWAAYTETILGVVWSARSGCGAYGMYSECPSVLPVAECLSRCLDEGRARPRHPQAASPSRRRHTGTRWLCAGFVLCEALAHTHSCRAARRRVPKFPGCPFCGVGISGEVVVLGVQGVGVGKEV